MQDEIERFVDDSFAAYQTARRTAATAIRLWPRPLQVSWDLITQHKLYPMPGFGIEGLQVPHATQRYSLTLAHSNACAEFQVSVNRVMALTLFHTQIAYSSTTNLMRPNSVGE